MRSKSILKPAIPLTSCFFVWIQHALLMLNEQQFLFVWSNPNQSNRRTVVQWYFPVLWRVFYCHGVASINVVLVMHVYQKRRNLKVCKQFFQGLTCHPPRDLTSLLVEVRVPDDEHLHSIGRSDLEAMLDFVIVCNVIRNKESELKQVKSFFKKCFCSLRAVMSSSIHLVGAVVMVLMKSRIGPSIKLLCL